MLWGLVLALHVFAMAFWVGGAMFAVLIMTRVVSLLDANQRQSVLLQSWTRYFRSVLHVGGLSVLTGFALVFHDGGFATVPPPVDIMMALGLIMAAWSLIIMRGPLVKARRAIRPQPATIESIRRQTAGILILGVLAITAAAFSRGI